MPSNAVSANTLFHFTNSVDNLINILSNEFRPHYCLEDFRIFNQVTIEPLEIAIPLISFCDLPLFNIKKHLTFYGNYGIGLDKKWGIKHGINPIIYTYGSSPLVLTLSKIMRFADEHKSSDLSDGGQIQRLNDLVTSYIKPYKGSMWRDGECKKNIRFYDEREWRYVPDVKNVKTIKLPSSLRKDQFLNETIRKNANDILARNFKLPFTPNDIKYLILKDEDEILPMIHSIFDIKSKFNPEKVKLLTTRIITLGQIDEDF